jgi:acid phosphatase family membrane protein YuiD
LALAVFLVEGFSNLFIVTLIFTIIVIRDVIGDKIFATHQENIMNRLIQQIMRHEKVQWNHLIGHTLVEVFFGMLLAVCVTLGVFYTLEVL